MEQTIPHLDEGSIQALIHGELTGISEVDATRHVAGCDDCRARIARAREEDEPERDFGRHQRRARLHQPTGPAQVAPIADRCGDVASR